MKSKIALLIFTIGFCQMAYSQNTLPYYLKQAIENSPLLQKQENNNKEIALDLEQFKAIYKAPKLSINSNILLSPIVSMDANTPNFEWLPSGSNNYFGYDLGATNGGQFQALATVDQPLFTNKYYTVQENQASLAQEQNANTIQLTKAELNQVVTHQYILCVQAQEQKNNIQNTIQIITEQKHQMEPLVNAGIYKLIDLKILEITLESSLIEKERLNGIYLNNFNTLKILCGIKDTTLYVLEEINLQLNPAHSAPSLFISKFRLDSLSINAQQKIFELRYLPHIYAFGDAGLNTTNQPNLNRMGFSIGVSLKWNLFDGHQKQINSEKSQIQLSNIETDRKYFENQNEIRKNNILTQMNNLDKQLLLIDKQLAEYNELLELYQIEFKRGLVSALELKILIKDIYIKQQVKVNTLMSKQILINSYNYWNL